MPERKPDLDLESFLPDEAALKTSLKGDVEYTSEVDPRLVERLKMMTSTPGRARAPDGARVYVPPTALPRSREARIAIREPSDPRRRAATQPSIRRVETRQRQKVVFIALGLVAALFVVWRWTVAPAASVSPTPAPTQPELRSVPPPVTGLPTTPAPAASMSPTSAPEPAAPTATSEPAVRPSPSPRPQARKPSAID